MKTQNAFFLIIICISTLNIPTKAAVSYQNPTEFTLLKLKKNVEPFAIKYPKQKNKKKTEIFSLLSFILALFSWLVIPGILAIIFGTIGLFRLKKSPNKRGKLLAKLGVIIPIAFGLGVLIGVGIASLLSP